MDNLKRFHITPYLHRQLKAHSPQMTFSAIDSASWAEWRVALRNKLHDLLSPWPERIPLAPETLSITDEGDYLREEIILQSHPHMEIPCSILRPKDTVGPRPAILALNGHGEGKNEIIGLTESKTGQGYGPEMVRAGYVVFAFDFFPFGQRKETEHNSGEGYEYACNSTLIRSLLWGFNLLTLNLWDAFRVLDFIQIRPEVDPSRIGVMGCSYGGTTSMYVAILDERIRASVLSGSLGEYRGHGIELDELCGAQVVPGILQWAEMGDIAGLLAPIPLLVESARNDASFPWVHTQPTLERLSEVYRTVGADERLKINIYDGGHHYYVDWVVSF